MINKEIIIKTIVINKYKNRMNLMNIKKIRIKM